MAGLATCLLWNYHNDGEIDQRVSQSLKVVLDNKTVIFH